MSQIRKDNGIPLMNGKPFCLLGFGFGLVGLDRWIIAPLFPCMVATDTAPGCGAPGLGLSYQAIGNLVGVLGIVWGIFAAISGRISDSIGHRKILIPAILLFSLMSGLSGMATGLASLIAIRGLMGLMEGSYCPTSFTATAAAAHPSRRGFLQGLATKRFRAFRIRSRSDHRHTTTKVRVLAAGLLGCSNSWIHCRSTAVCGIA